MKITKKNNKIVPVNDIETKGLCMTELEKTVLKMVQKITPEIDKSITQLQDDDSKKYILSAHDCQKRWLDAVLTESPLPEIGPDTDTIQKIFNRIALLTNFVNSAAYKAMTKVAENESLVVKYKWIVTLTNYQLKWIDAYRYNLPLPEDVVV